MDLAPSIKSFHKFVIYSTLKQQINFPGTVFILIFEFNMIII